jgi:hypothetical protein
VISYLVPWLTFTIGFALALDRVFAEFIIPRSPGAAAKIKRLLRSVDRDEVGVFGSSRADGDFVPTELGEHVYNYGLSGIEYGVTEVLLEIELAKPKRAPLIVNVDPEFFDETHIGIGDVNAVIPYCTLPAFRDVMERAGAYRAYYRFPGARFFGAYELHLKDFINGFASPTKELVRGANLEKNRLPPARFRQVVEERLAWRSSFSVSNEEDARFQTLLARHREREIILVVAPYHPSYYEVFSDFPKVVQYLSDIERTHANVIVLIFDGRKFDDSMFYDTTHLNAEGARRFSRELRRRLDDRGIKL